MSTACAVIRLIIRNLELAGPEVPPQACDRRTMPSAAEFARVFGLEEGATVASYPIEQVHVYDTSLQVARCRQLGMRGSILNRLISWLSSVFRHRCHATRAPAS